MQEIKEKKANSTNSIKLVEKIKKGIKKGSFGGNQPREISLLKFINADVNDETLAKLYDYRKETILKKIGLICSYILNSISDENIRKATLVQKITSFGILTDKAMLLQGLPTARIEIQNIADSDLDSRIRDIVSVQ